MPLALATRLVSARAYGSDARISASRLTGIAHTMAVLVPVYVRVARTDAFRRLTEDEALSGVFRTDGAELHFSDGRAPLRDIAAIHEGIDEVVRMLASAIDGVDGARDLLRGRGGTPE